MARHAIFGDSYISRLQKYTKNYMDLQGDCRFFGAPGMTTRNKFEYSFDQMLKFKPKFVFINLASFVAHRPTRPDFLPSPPLIIPPGGIGSG